MHLGFGGGVSLIAEDRPGFCHRPSPQLCTDRFVRGRATVCGSRKDRMLFPDRPATTPARLRARRRPARRSLDRRRWPGLRRLVVFNRRAARRLVQGEIVLVSRPGRNRSHRPAKRATGPAAQAACRTRRADCRPTWTAAEGKPNRGPMIMSITRTSMTITVAYRPVWTTTNASFFESTIARELRWH